MSDAGWPKTRWYRFTPDRLVVLVLVVEGLLLACEPMRWFPNGWPVLIAWASLGAALLAGIVWLVLSLFCRWRFQFSLRSLLLLAVVVAIPSSWLAAEVRQAKRQWAAFMTFDFPWCIYTCTDGLRGPYPPSVFEFTGERIADPSPQPPRWLRDFLGYCFFKEVTYVALCRNPSDAELEQIRELPQFQSLVLYDDRVSDCGLERIEGLTQLRTLSLVNTNVTDAGLEHLKGLTQLGKLSLYGNSKITDVGLRELRQALPNCKITLMDQGG
jgi:hypothetical protein